MDAAVKVEVLRASCCVAGADGTTGDQEFSLVQKLAKEIGVGKASLDAMIARAQSDDGFYQQQFKILKSEPTKTLAMLFQIAMADGQISEQELQVLAGLASNLNVPEEIFQQVYDAAKANLPGA